jgi:hypothetical protein
MAPIPQTVIAEARKGGNAENTEENPMRTSEAFSGGRKSCWILRCAQNDKNLKL